MSIRLPDFRQVVILTNNGPPGFLPCFADIRNGPPGFLPCFADMKNGPPEFLPCFSDMRNGPPGFLPCFADMKNGSPGFLRCFADMRNGPPEFPFTFCDVAKGRRESRQWIIHGKHGSTRKLSVNFRVVRGCPTAGFWLIGTPRRCLPAAPSEGGVALSLATALHGASRITARRFSRYL